MGKRGTVGGQAVIEGVMMRGSKGIATAVRKEDGEIAVSFEESIPYTKKNKLFGLPVVRGFVSLLESLIVGIKTLNYSASFFEDEEDASRFDKWFQGVFKEKSHDIIMGFTLIVSLLFSVLIFFITPTFAANIFKRLNIIQSSLGLNIAEGIIRVIIFLFYIYFIGKLEDIHRVFEYHGAEHKSIFCYEAEMELSAENAQRFSRLHPRCGTNFLFLVMIVSIVLFSLTGWSSIWQRILYRVVLLPLISGLTYELIKWMGKSSGKFAAILSYPGLMLQKLTTKEPDLSQLEVAIKALKVAEGLEEPIWKSNTADAVDLTAAETFNSFAETCNSFEEETFGNKNLEEADINNELEHNNYEKSTDKEMVDMGKNLLENTDIDLNDQD